MATFSDGSVKRKRSNKFAFTHAFMLTSRDSETGKLRSDREFVIARERAEKKIAQRKGWRGERVVHEEIIETVEVRDEPPPGPAREIEIAGEEPGSSLRFCKWDNGETFRVVVIEGEACPPCGIQISRADLKRIAAFVYSHVNRKQP